MKRWIELFKDMPIVGTSSLEKQVDTSAADARRGSVAESLQDSESGVHGCVSLKRERSQQGLEEPRAEKRVKLESNAGLPWNSANGNDMGPTAPHRGVEDCQDTNSGDELAKERDDLRPLVQSIEISTPVLNDTGLTDLLNDLDDAGNSDLDEDEFGVGSHLWPEALCDEGLRNGSINGNGVQAHTPQPEIIVEALNISSEQAQRDGDIGTKVRAHSPQPETITKALGFSSEQAQRDGDIGTMVQAHSPQPETITEAQGFSPEQAQRDGDIGTMVQAHSPQPETITEALGFSSEQAQRDGDIGTMVQAHSPQPETITEALGFSSEQAQRDGDIGTMVQAHSPQPETITEALGFSSEQAQRDGDIGTMVQAHSPQPETITEAQGFSSEQAQRDGDIGTMVQAHSPQPETITEAQGFSPEQAQRDGDIGTMVQAHSPQPETITEAQGFSPEQAQRDGDIETMVQAHDAIRRERPSAEIVILDSDSDDDDDLIMFDNLGEASQLKNTVKLEPGAVKVEKNISQLEDAVKVEPEISRQPENSYQLENAVKVEPENPREAEKSSKLGPSEISELTNAVKLEFEDLRRAPDSRGSHGFEASTMQDMHRGGLEQPGVMLQSVVQDGRLMWALVPRNTDATLGSPSFVNRVHPRPPQVNGLPYGLGCSSGFVPKDVRESVSSGEQAGPSYSLIPPATSADVPFYRGHTQLSGMGNGNHAIAGQAVVSVPSPSQPAGSVQDATASGEQAGPSHDWTSLNSAAVVPYRYDSTVSTPRVEVTRALQQYLHCINKAKDDRARELLAQRESTSNDLVKEGNRRGLECRPDIVAYNDIKRAKADVNPGVNVGDLPGVEVGDKFTYRHQMAVVGLHRLPNVGIDYGYPPPDMIPTATAIVMMPKAGYVDDKDYGATILYTGQGGRKKRNQQAPFVCDQELKKGNLALAKNYERKLPVRVIRGHNSGSSGPGFLGYSYDGLYIIVSYEFSDGINGFKVFKYHMERLEDQPPIPPCIPGCTAHAWNTSRGAMEALPLQAMDPTVDVKPICMQVMDPPVETKQICI